MNKILTCIVMGVAIAGLAAEQSPYKKGALALSDRIDQASMTVSVGNFVYGNTGLMSGFSAMLRDELRAALANTGKFKVISRERLNELVDEKRFQNMDLLEPGSSAATISVKGVEGIVRGKFYYRHPDVTIFAELLRLDGGETTSVKIILDAKDIAVDIIPANLDGSEKNIVDVRDRVKKVPRDFGITLKTKGLKRDYKSGEKVVFEVRSEKDCHIAVFCHQTDGSTVLLFPNPWVKDTRLRAGETATIPGNVGKNFEIEVGPPFGSDVVQAIACTCKSALHSRMEQLVRAESAPGYRGITRGLFARAVKESLEDDPVSDPAAGKPQWSENHIVISTYK